MLSVSLLLFQFKKDKKADMWLNIWIRSMDSFLFVEGDKWFDFAL